jgi:hypothetical protein
MGYLDKPGENHPQRTIISFSGNSIETGWMSFMGKLSAGRVVVSETVQLEGLGSCLSLSFQMKEKTSNVNLVIGSKPILKLIILQRSVNSE